MTIIIKDLTDSNKNGSIKDLKGFNLVYFTAPWCGACKGFYPALAEIAEDLNNSITVFKLDVDENPLTASSYNVRSLPTSIIFKDGIVADTKIGVSTKAEMVKFIKGVICR